MKSARFALAAALIAAGISLAYWSSHAQEQEKPGIDTAVKNNAAQEAKKRFEPLNRILATLHDKTELNFSQTALNDALKFIEDRHKIDIQLDVGALEDLKLNPSNALVSLDVRSIALRSALKLLLDPLDLAYVAQLDGSLLITIKDKASNILETRVYDVRHLLTNSGKQAADYDSMIKLVFPIVQPSSWNELGGPGSLVRVFNGCLSISQTQEVHDEIMELFTALSRAGDANDAGKFEPISVRGVNQSQTIQKLNQALESKIDLDFNETPLSLVVEGIREKVGAKSQFDIQFDRIALRDLTLDADSMTVSLKRPGVRVADVLKGILEPHDLTYVIKNEVIFITSKDRADEMLTIRLYPVADLVQQAVESKIDERPRAAEAVEDLVEAITGTVYENSWSELGGPGTIKSFNLNGTILVVEQTEYVHAQIEDLLAQLRAVRNKQRDDPSWKPAESQKSVKPELRVYLLRGERLVQKVEPTLKPKLKEDKAKPTNPATASLICGTFAVTSVPNSAAEPLPMSPDEVLQVVVTLVEPESWREKDAYIDAVTGRLIVRQTPRVHRKIEKLLRQLGVLESVTTERPEQRNVPVSSGGFGGGF